MSDGIRPRLLIPVLQPAYEGQQDRPGVPTVGAARGAAGLAGAPRRRSRQDLPPPLEVRPKQL